MPGKHVKENLPSGKRSHSNGISTFLIGNTSTQSGAPIFQPAMLDDPGVYGKRETGNFWKELEGRGYHQAHGP